MVLGQHRRMWLEAMRQTEQRVYGFGSLKDGYALVGIHLRKQKCCLKKGTTSECTICTDMLAVVWRFSCFTNMWNIIRGNYRRSKHKSRLNTAKQSENLYQVITGTYETSKA